MKIVLTHILLSVFFATGLLAQVKQVTLKDVENQGVFIDAMRERLLGNYEKSIELFGKVLEKAPNNSVAYYELALIQVSLKDFEKAKKYIDRAISLDGTNQWYRILQAKIFSERGEYEAAAKVYTFLIKAEPDNEEYYFSKAYFLVKAGLIKKAINTYNKLEKRDGINEELSRKKHALYLSLGDFDKAGKELEKLANAYPKSTEYKHLLAEYYKKNGQGEKASKIYHDILTINPDDSRAKLAIVGEDISGSQNDNTLEALVPIFQRADVDIDSKVVELLPVVNKISTTQDAKLTQSALHLADILREVHPDDAKAYALSGDLYYSAGDKTKSVEMYKKAVKLNSGVYTVWEQMLLTVKELEDYDQLLTLSEQALDVFPNQVVLNYLNGLAYAKTNNHQKAIKALSIAGKMSRKTPKLRYDIYALLANEYFVTKQFDKAKTAIDEALTLKPDSPVLLERYGDIFQALGDSANAKIYWQKALKNGGNKERLNGKLK